METSISAGLASPEGFCKGPVNLHKACRLGRLERGYGLTGISRWRIIQFRYQAMLILGQSEIIIGAGPGRQSPGAEPKQAGPTLIQATGEAVQTCGEEEK